MRHHSIPLALFVVLTFALTTPAFSREDWSGSYAVDSQCFCIGEVDRSVAARIVPTPIGGQTVQQVCSALGKGPGLVFSNASFNHPVFKDSQCGHGPYANGATPTDLDCVGTIDGTYASCQPAGPKWDLLTAYAEPSAPAAAQPDPLVVSDEASSTDDVPVEAPDASEKTVAGEAGEAQVLKSVDTQQSLPEGVVDFTGRTITLGDDRYYQARSDLPAKGGEPGSRIILDGLVFVRDDEHLVAEDLYWETEEAEVATAAIDEASKEDTVESISERSLGVADAIESTQAAESGDEASKALAEKERLAAEKAAQDALQRERRARNAARLAAEPQARADAERELATQKTQESQESRERLSGLLQLAKEQQLAKQKDAQQAARDEQALKQESVKSAEDSENADVAEVAEQAPQSEKTSKSVSDLLTARAFRLPSDTRASSRDFGYFEVMPTTYDFGGVGLVLEGSAQSHSQFHYFGRVGVADTYREVVVGGGYFLTPARATRMTFVLLAGVEFGSFDLSGNNRDPDFILTVDDSGIYLGAVGRYVLNDKVEFKGGVSYSSFFNGDATFIGGGYYHITPRLDILSQFEFGDNDALGVGIRYYY